MRSKPKGSGDAIAHVTAQAWRTAELSNLQRQMAAALGRLECFFKLIRRLAFYAATHAAMHHQASSQRYRQLGQGQTGCARFGSCGTSRRNETCEICRLNLLSGVSRRIMLERLGLATRKSDARKSDGRKSDARKREAETAEEVGIRTQVALKHAPRKQPVLPMRVHVSMCKRMGASCLAVPARPVLYGL